MTAAERQRRHRWGTAFRADSAKRPVTKPEVPVTKPDPEADGGEIERLRARVEELQAELGEHKDEAERLRRDLAALREISAKQFGKLGDELRPLLKGLAIEGKKSMARMAPIVVEQYTNQLTRLLIARGILDEHQKPARRKATRPPLATDDPAPIPASLRRTGPPR